MAKKAKKIYPYGVKISIEDAIARIENKEVIAIPTDTVYGFVALEEAAGKIYALKGRPSDKPLILLLSLEKDLPFLSTEGRRLASLYWPGPLTLVIEGKSYRVPDHPEALALLKKTGPLVSTSANLSGSPPAMTPDEIEREFGKEFPILEGPLPKGGVASTIVSLENQTWTILREGAISKDELKKGLTYER